MFLAHLLALRRAVALLASLLLFLLLVPLMAAHAEGLPTHTSKAAAAAPPVVHPWTGCAIGGSLGWVDAVSQPFESGIGVGTTGEKVGALAACDVQMGIFVVGGEVGYNLVFGDMRTAGIQSELDIMGRAGLLVNQSTLVYGHLDWSRLDSNDNPFSGTHVDGWKVGPGIEMKLGATPMSLDLRASYGTYTSAIEGADVHTYDLMAHLKYKFY